MCRWSLGEMICPVRVCDSVTVTIKQKRFFFFFPNSSSWNGSIEGQPNKPAASKPEPSALPGAVQKQRQCFPSKGSESSVPYTRAIRFNDPCQYHSFNISVEGGSFTYNGTHESNLRAVFIRTSCGDCMQMLMNVESGKRIHLLYSRRRQLEEFRRQAECLKMPPPHVMDPTKELCPQEAVGNPSAPAETETQWQCTYVSLLSLYFTHFLWLM